jgi:hypothetical protein
MVPERNACCTTFFWGDYGLPSLVRLITNVLATPGSAENIGVTGPFPFGTGIASSDDPTFNPKNTYF